jgi:hypothetical protein
MSHNGTQQARASATRRGGVATALARDWRRLLLAAGSGQPLMLRRIPIGFCFSSQEKVFASRPRVLRVGAVLVALVAAFAFQAGVPLRATYGARVNVDEPFYLLTTVSLLEDGDLDLANDYALGRYRQFFDHQDELWLQSEPTADGRVLSPHNVGLSLLLVPAYALGGLDAAKAFLGILGGATVGMTALLAFRATGRAGPSLAAAALLATTAPFFVYTTQVYPEMAAALLATTCAWLILAAQPGPRTAIGVMLCVTGLAWLGSKYIPLASVLTLLCLARLRQRAALILLAALALSGLAYAGFHLATYGALTPYGVNRLYVGTSTAELVALHFEFWNRVYRLLGLWVDGEFGLFRWAPILVLALPAAVAIARRPGPVRWTLLTLLGTQILVAVFMSITMRGWWFPGRMLVVVLPLLSVLLAEAVAWASLRPYRLALLAALAGYSAALTLALVLAARSGQLTLAVDPFTLAWPPFAAVRDLFPVYTTYTATTWLRTLAWCLGLAAIGVVTARRSAQRR